MAACLLAVREEIARHERRGEVTTYRTYKAQYNLLHRGAVVDIVDTRKRAEALRDKIQQGTGNPKVVLEIQVVKLCEVTK